MPNRFDPQKIFIGLIEFFSIILPGALLAHLIRGEVGPWVQSDSLYCRLGSAEGWAIFLFIGYLLGSLAFLLRAGWNKYTIGCGVSRITPSSRHLPS